MSVLIDGNTMGSKKPRANKRSRLIDQNTKKSDIAIIGMACRFPDAADYDMFWDNLYKGINSVKKISKKRWDTGKHCSIDAGAPDKEVCDFNGMLEDFDKFDSGFFNISPREANNMDPQQRLLLEETWHCIEDSGISLSKLQEKKTSIYVGVTGNDYNLVTLVKDKDIDSYASLGSFECMVANRVSHAFGFSGKSISLDTACASSLVALHEAKQTLLCGESDFAFSAGVCVAFHPWRYITFSKAKMMSPDGQCKTFDKDANGFIQGEGVAVLLLQRLDDAVANGNHIYGVIKGSAVNHCGHSLTIAAPSVKAQKNVILSALEDAQINPETISYIEAHGTGTTLGDPIEVEALTQVFRKYTSKKQFCNIGSVKTNIGHLGSAAGVTGVVKILLMMKNRKIPKLLHLKTLNPIIDFENSPFLVSTKSTGWKSPDKDIPLRAGVSAFGFGGVNAHVIIEEWQPGVGSDVNEEKEKVFVLSAKNRDSLEDNIGKWKSFIDNGSIEGFNLDDVCSTLLTGREGFSFRCGKVVGNKTDIRKFLNEDININEIFTGEWCLRIGEFSEENKTFIKELTKYGVFERKLNEALECLGRANSDGHNLIDFENHFGSQSDSLLYKLILGYTLTSGILELGFKPSVIVCEKFGVWIGLVISGMASLEEIIRVISGCAKADQLTLSHPAIPFYDPIGKTVIKPYKFDKSYFEGLFDGLALNNEALEYYINKARLLFTSQYTFKKNIEEWAGASAKYGYDIPGMIYDDRYLKSNKDEYIKEKLILMAAVVSAMLKLNKKWDLPDEHDYIKDERFREALNLVLDRVMSEEILLGLLAGDNPDYVEIASILDKRQANINPNNSYTYLKKASRVPVEPENAGKWIEACIGSDISNVVGINPGANLDLGKVSIKDLSGIKVNMVKSSTKALKQCLLDLWLNGVGLNWGELYPDGSFKKLPLPTYLFKRDVYWLPLDDKKGLRTLSLHPMVDINESTLAEEKFKKTLKIDEFYVKDHVVDGKVILPGVAYLEMARAAGRLAGGRDVKAIKDVVWVKPVVMDKESKDLYIGLYPEWNHVAYEIYSMRNGQKTVHSQGKLVFDDDCNLPEPRTFDIEAIKNRCEFSIDKQECYESVFSQCIGFDYGPAFQVTQRAFGGENESFEILALPEHLKDDFSDYVLHPSIIDAALRAITWIGGEGAHKDLILHIPFALGELEIFGRLTEDCFSYATIVEETKGKSSGSRRFNISILDSNGTELVRIKDFTIRELRGELPVSSAKKENTLNYYDVRYLKTPLSSKEYVVKTKVSDRILLFDDNKDRREAISKDIKRILGFDTVFVTGGTGFKKVGSTLYEINRVDEENYIRLLGEIDKDGIGISQVIHMWNMDEEPFDIAGQSVGEIFSQLDKCLDKGLYSLLYIFKAFTLLKAENKVKCLFAYISNEQSTAPQFDIISAFAKSVVTANHKFEFVNLNLDKGCENLKLLSRIIIGELDENKKPGTNDVRYTDDERYVKTVCSVEASSKSSVQIKEGGVYIITGGIGGLGMLTADYLASNYKAKLVLTGRTQPDRKKLKRIDSLKELGSEVLFIKCDVSKFEEAKALVSAAKECFGKIDGIIHCAGITDEISVVNANKEVYEKVLSPKIFGTVNLDMACGSEDLDFFLMFSSIASVIGDYGRGSYSVANRFMDGYAAYRDQLKENGIRKGQTLSVNWPLWQDGGMQVKGDEASVYFEYSGMATLDANIAFKALEDALASGSSQFIVTYGDTQKINRVLGVHPDTDDVQKPNPIVDLKEEDRDCAEQDLFKTAEDYLKGILSKTTNMPAEKIDSKAALERYGIDSIMIMELNKLMEKDFESLPRTLFFEYGNIFDLANYFVQNYYESLRVMVAKSITKGASAGNDNAINEPVIKKEPGNVQPGNRFMAYAGKNVQEATDRNNGREDIAIIGISGKYPMANTLEEFWENLKNGRDCITEIPGNRWEHSKYFDPQKGKRGKVYCKWGGFINDVDKFDALFFQISPREAQVIDPQERLFLEAVYQAVEDSGYTRSSLSTSSVGVFVGIMNGHYQLFGAEELMKGNMMDIRSSYASIANRVSYFFNFNGPSIGLDTMCSGSLTAIHLACQSIYSGESEMAVAGGVNVIIHPAKYVFLSEQKFGSSEGKCRAFGDGGDGYVPSEGVGAVLLKPLSKAIADRDNIYGVIKASTINHGGKTNGYTVPNVSAQGSLVLGALKKAGINPETISYLEAHGTGTKLGDPIEIAGLSKAFKEFTSKKQFCAIGSVKANIGHAESAAGIASLTKVLLQMKYKTIVPSILAEELNKNIDFNNSPFYVQRSLTEWERPTVEENGKIVAYPRRAGISSFGAGGTNVHLIVEEYVQEEKIIESSNKAQLIILSAKNPERLKAYTNKMVNYLKEVLDIKNTALNGFNDYMKRLEKDILMVGAEVLFANEDEIKTNESLHEYGIGPIEFTNLSLALEGMFDIEIAPGVLAELETIHSMAKYLSTNFRQQVEGKYNVGYETVRKNEDGISLEDMAYTLQVGREAMESRLGIVAASVFELLEKLERFCCGELEHIDGLYLGNVSVNKGITVPSPNEMKQCEEDIMSGRKLDKTAQLWVSGIDFDWQKIYQERKFNKIKLPTYPFRRDRYWIPVNTESRVDGIKGWHPFLDSVVPGLSLGNGLVYSKKLFSCENILDHHKIQGRAVFPGVAHIEMGLAAIRQVADNTISTVTGITWLRPLVVDGEKDIKIALNRDENGISYEISGQEEDGLVTYSTGSFITKASSEKVEQRIVLEGIKKRCGRYVDKDTVYSAFSVAGIDYGPHFQGIESLQIGIGEALASICIPVQFENGLNTYMLHPTVMDAALQSISGITGYIGTGSRSTVMPYAIEKLELINDLKPLAYAYVKQNGQGHFDILLTDETGLVSVKMSGVSVRRAKDSYDDFFYTPVWKKVESKSNLTAENERNVLLIYHKEAIEIADDLSALHNKDYVIRVELGQTTRKVSAQVIEVDIENPNSFSEIVGWLDKPDTVYFLGGIDKAFTGFDRLDVLEESQKKGVLSLFRMVKAFFGMGWESKPIEIKVITNDVYSIITDECLKPYASSLHGFANSFAREQVQWQISCIDASIRDGEKERIEERTTAQLIHDEKCFHRGKEVAIHGGDKYIRVMHPVTLPQQPASSFKQHGVYMILGGAGGIGLELSKYLAEKFEARIVLVGRSELGKEQKDKIGAIETNGGKVVYIRADATDEDSMRKAAALAETEFGHINGVIHSAIVLKDMTIKNMDELTLKAVLSPKVRGSVVLAKVFEGYPLDFMMFFSSAQSISSNPGQSNYAAACTFKDVYALYLSENRPYPVKVVNWGFWGSVGIVANEEYNKLLAARGIYSIKPAEGMEAVERILANPIRQVMPIRADRSQLELMGADFSSRVEIYGDIKTESLKPGYEVLQPLMEDDSMERHIKAFGEMEKLGELLLADVLKKAGIFRDGSVEYGKNEFAAKLKIVPSYKKLFEALMGILHKAGSIEYKDNKIVINGNSEGKGQVTNSNELETLKNKLIYEYPEISANINLLWICLKNYPDVLSGKIPATDILFPDSSMELVQGIYRGNAFADYFNNLVKWSLLEYIEAKLPALKDGDRIKIAEVGAGTGGTSAGVFNSIKKHGDKLEYFYTDISAGFIKYGEKNFGKENPFAKFTLLNIENNIKDQGFEEGTFDAVIATNVLHATRSIGNTLLNIKSMLKAGGIVIINEATAFSEFLTFTFGLLDGWWLYEDKQARIPDSPLLSPDMWKTALKQKGFKIAAELGKSTTGINIPTQDVIVAQSDGVVIKTLNIKSEALAQESDCISCESELTKSMVAATGNAGIKPVKYFEQRLTEGYASKNADDETVRNYIQNRIIDSLIKALGIKRHDIDMSRQFSEYGADSITGVELIKNINELLGIKLKTTALFDYVNVAELARFIHDRDGKQIAGMIQPAGGYSVDIDDCAISQQYMEDENLKNFIEDRIVDSIVKSLGVLRQDINFGRQFSEYGVDSITGLELIKNINNALGINLRATVLFDYGNVKELAKQICLEHETKINCLAQNGGNKDNSAYTYDRELEALEKLAKGELSIKEVFEIMGDNDGEL